MLPYSSTVNQGAPLVGGIVGGGMVGGGMMDGGMMAGGHMGPGMMAPGTMGGGMMGGGMMPGGYMGPGMMADGMMGGGMMGGGMMAGGHMGPSMMAPGMAGGMMGAGMMSGGNMVDMNVSVPLTQAAPTTGMIAHGGYVHSIPMNDGPCRNRFFDPMFTAALPLSTEDYDSLICELNEAMDAAMPPRIAQMMPFFMIAFGFITFAGGGFFAVIFGAGPAGFRPSAFLPVGIGFMIFVAGGITMVIMGCQLEKGITACRMKLSEFNGRYAAKKIDFQLHEQQHLQMHTSGGHSNFNQGYGARGVNVHVVTKYTLVMQVLDSAGRRSIPEPSALAAQALQQASAPPLETEMSSFEEGAAPPGQVARLAVAAPGGASNESKV